VKNKGEVLIYTLNNPPLFFTGRKLRPPGIRIEVTAPQISVWFSVDGFSV